METRRRLRQPAVQPPRRRLRRNTHSLGKASDASPTGENPVTVFPSASIIKFMITPFFLYS
jgi:hypothetical protein